MRLGKHQRSLIARAKISPGGILCLHAIKVGETTLSTMAQAEEVAERLVNRGLLKRRRKGFYEVCCPNSNID